MRTVRPGYVVIGMLGLAILGVCLPGCSVSNEVPPRAAPIGMPTHRRLVWNGISHLATYAHRSKDTIRGSSTV